MRRLAFAGVWCWLMLATAMKQPFCDGITDWGVFYAMGICPATAGWALIHSCRRLGWIAAQNRHVDASDPVMNGFYLKKWAKTLDAQAGRTVPWRDGSNGPL